MADLVFVLVTVVSFVILTFAVRAGQPVNAENAVGLVVAVLLTFFLIAALLFPERF